MTGGADMPEAAVRTLSKRLGVGAPDSPDPAASTPLFNLTKTLAKIVIVGAVLVYALWPERAYLSHMLAAPRASAQAALTNN